MCFASLWIPKWYWTLSWFYFVLTDLNPHLIFFVEIHIQTTVVSILFWTLSGLLQRQLFVFWTPIFLYYYQNLYDARLKILSLQLET